MLATFSSSITVLSDMKSELDVAVVCGLVLAGFDKDCTATAAAVADELRCKL